MKKITVLDVQRFKDEGRKITMLTAYDVQKIGRASCRERV